MSIITCIAPVNIAVIKYWGKRDDNLILPLNDSFSTTLSTKEMRATTSIMRSPDFTENRLWLNGREESFKNPRLKRCLDEIRKLAKAENDTPETDWKVHICSENNFPTAAGLASSAAGYACLVYTLAKVFGVKGDVTRIARQGSGSACRSLAGGFVCWERGIQTEGGDSIAKQVFPAEHWPSLRILILIVTENKKKVSSTIGMQRSVDTSDLLLHRIRCCVPERIEMIKRAIAAKEFETFGDITIRDSNQFHAIALDTYPPAIYMNDTSHIISELVHAYNDIGGETKVAYTFDAGPNACLYMEEKDVPEVAALIRHVFPPKPGTEDGFFTGIPVAVPPLSQELKEMFPPNEAGLLQYTILTELGTGPEQLTDPLCHLLTDDGMPKELKEKVTPDEPVPSKQSNLTDLGSELEPCQPKKLKLLGQSEREERYFSPSEAPAELLHFGLGSGHKQEELKTFPPDHLMQSDASNPATEAVKENAVEDTSFKKLLEQFVPQGIDSEQRVITLQPASESGDGSEQPTDPPLGAGPTEH